MKICLEVKITCHANSLVFTCKQVVRGELVYLLQTGTLWPFPPTVDCAAAGGFPRPLTLRRRLCTLPLPALTGWGGGVRKSTELGGEGVGVGMQMYWRGWGANDPPATAGAQPAASSQQVRESGKPGVHRKEAEDEGKGGREKGSDERAVREKRGRRREISPFLS